MRHQRLHVCARHVGVEHALQDVHRTAGLDQSAHQQVIAAILDQFPGDRIRRFGILRRPHPRAGGFDLFPNVVGERLPHQLLRKIHRRRDQHHAGHRRCGLFAQFAHQQQRQPAAHRRPDQHLRAFGEGPVHRYAFLEPAADGAVGEVAARFAMAGIVEAQAGAAIGLRPGVERRGLGAFHVGLEAAQPDQPWLIVALALAHAHGDGPRGRRLYRQGCQAGFTHERFGNSIMTVREDRVRLWGP
jgi:hypothetical protein